MRWPPSTANWPHAEVSQQIRCGHDWHVQQKGEGPTLLLIHGAGGATQSWRGLFPLLSKTHHVVAVDLPGQGFTRLRNRGRCGLDPVAQDLTKLIAQEGWTPSAIIGHSAGAAVGLRMALETPVPVIGINAALSNFKGLAGWLFPALAKVLALNPLTAVAVSATMTRKSVDRLLVGTGSIPTEEMTRLYFALASDRAHVDATLAMMSQWNLDPLLTKLDQINSPVLMITGAKDKAVPPDVSAQAAELLPDGRLVALPDLGHLMHEEEPELIVNALAPLLPG